jgi:N-carbamoyl-L-amino-acid hydrolase
MSPLIDEARLWGRLMTLAEIGATPAGGVNRQALTEGEIEAWRLVVGWAQQAGLEPSTDPAGNLFLTLRGTDPQAAPLLVGSHLDSQPTGGRFDGAAGVLAALEVAVAMAERGQKRARDIVVVAWMNEEGCRFAPGMMGSEAFCGVRTIVEIRAVKDAAGISVSEALDKLHASFPDVPMRPPGFVPSHYLELHIEQGPILEAQARAIGIVTGIQGKKAFEVTIEGSEGHAGTLAMAERRDAIATFARIACALNVAVGGHDDIVKFTIGRLRVEPNAPSVVPSRVIFSIDLRHPDNAVLNALGERLTALCREHAAPCVVTVKLLVDAPSNDFDPHLQALIVQAATALGHASMPILSAAGHDARHLAKVCRSAMIFIPCRDGISHAENEWVEPAHMAAGAAVLARVVAELADG